MTVALYLLSRLDVDTPLVVAIVGMVVLGLGLGMVMQVLVLAAQNSVDYRMLGVATSGSTLFRQIGGSIGVAAFGAIFANRLGSEFAARLPGAEIPDATNPAVVRQLPPAIHAPYVDSVAAALQPVFLTAAAISVPRLPADVAPTRAAAPLDDYDALIAASAASWQAPSVGEVAAVERWADQRRRRL